MELLLDNCKCSSGEGYKLTVHEQKRYQKENISIRLLKLHSIDKMRSTNSFSKMKTMEQRRTVT